MNQSWIIVNCILGNKHKWNFNQNSNIFIEENAFENDVCVILSWPQCVKRSTGHQESTPDTCHQGDKSYYVHDLCLFYIVVVLNQSILARHDMLIDVILPLSISVTSKIETTLNKDLLIKS